MSSSIRKTNLFYWKEVAPKRWGRVLYHGFRCPFTGETVNYTEYKDPDDIIWERSQEYGKDLPWGNYEKSEPKPFNFEAWLSGSRQPK